jgi:hypothetical protein
MTDFDPMSLASPFRGGYDRIRSGLSSAVGQRSSLSERCVGIAQASLGVLQCVPVVGHAIEATARVVRDDSLHARVLLRKQVIAQEIQSPSFQIQEVFFDTCIHPSAEQSVQAIMRELDKILGDSCPDLQIASLIKHLDDYLQKSTEISEEGKKEFLKIRQMLSDALETAICITCCLLEPSEVKEKEYKEELARHIQQRLLNLREGEVMLLPAGFANGNAYDPLFSGHSVAISVERKADSYRFVVFNSGSEPPRGWLSLVGRTAPGANPIPIQEQRVIPYAYENIPLGSEGNIGRLMSGWIRLSSEKTFIQQFHMYKDLASMGTEVETPPEARGHKHQRCSNCTRKSLRCWMHQQMGRCGKDYWRFRNSSTKEMVDRVKSMRTKSSGDITYTHPLGRIGASTRVPNVAVNAVLGVYGFVKGRRVRLKISKQQMDALMSEAERVTTLRGRH